MGADELNEHMLALRQLHEQERLSRDCTIVLLHAYYAWLAKVKTGEYPGPANARVFVASLLGVSQFVGNETVRIWEQSMPSSPRNNGRLRCLGTTGNFSRKRTSVCRGHDMYRKVRELVRMRRKNHERVTAVQVLEFLINDKHTALSVQSSILAHRREYQNDFRTVQLYLQRKAFKTGRRKDSLGTNSKHEALCAQFLRLLLENRALPPSRRRREVYLDESYILHHYNLVG